MFGFPCLKAVSTFDLDVLTRLKQACELKWCVVKSKKPDVERLPVGKGESVVKQGKGTKVVGKKGNGTKVMVKQGKGTKVVVKKGQGVVATADKEEMANQDNMGMMTRRGIVGGKAKKNIHPRQTRA